MRWKTEDFWAGMRWSFVGPNPPRKWAEQILVCLVTFKPLKRQAAIHLFVLSCSLIPDTKVFLTSSTEKTWNVISFSSGYLIICFFFSLLLEQPKAQQLCLTILIVLR